MRFPGIIITTVLMLFAVSGNAFAQESGAKWFTSNYTTADTNQSVASLTYGIPETDAVAFNAVCEGGKQGPQFPLMLMLNTGNMPNNKSVNVTFAASGTNATYACKVQIASSEYAGVQIQIGIDDPLWQVLKGQGQLSFAIAGQNGIVVPLGGAGAETDKFIQSCRAFFAAFDASVKPDAAAATIYTYSCNDGSKFTARFDNSRSYSVAHISRNGEPEVALIQGPSGSGATYSNGNYTLQTKADDAVLTRGDVTISCKSN